MLNITKVGRTISELRQKKDMTQMELAEKLNISYQAVSNWERGNSMPDISKLPELAQIFDVTIDYLLGESSPLVYHVAQNNMDDYCEHNEITASELSEVAPILKPTQVKTALQKVKKIDAGDLRALLPFLDQNTVDDLARKAKDSKELTALAPFVSQNVIDQIALDFVGQGDCIRSLLPFVSKAIVDSVAERYFSEGKFSDAKDLYPFMSSGKLEQIAESEFEKKNMSTIKSMAPFLRKEFLRKQADKFLPEGDLDMILPIAPFLDPSILTDYIKKQLG